MRALLPQSGDRLGDRFDHPRPAVIDPDQTAAYAFRAACTPDFYLFDAERLLVYRGQFDSSRPDSGIPVSGEDLRQAVDAAAAAGAVVPIPLLWGALGACKVLPILRRWAVLGGL